MTASKWPLSRFNLSNLLDNTDLISRLAPIYSDLNKMGLGNKLGLDILGRKIMNTQLPHIYSLKDTEYYSQLFIKWTSSLPETMI